MRGVVAGVAIIAAILLLGTADVLPYWALVGILAVGAVVFVSALVIDEFRRLRDTELGRDL